MTNNIFLKVIKEVLSNEVTRVNQVSEQKDKSLLQVGRNVTVSSKKREALKNFITNKLSKLSKEKTADEISAELRTAQVQEKTLEQESKHADTSPAQPAIATVAEAPAVPTAPTVTKQAAQAKKRDVKNAAANAAIAMPAPATVSAPSAVPVSTSASKLVPEAPRALEEAKPSVCPFWTDQQLLDRVHHHLTETRDEINLIYTNQKEPLTNATTIIDRLVKWCNEIFKKLKQVSLIDLNCELSALGILSHQMARFLALEICEEQDPPNSQAFFNRSTPLTTSISEVRQALAADVLAEFDTLRLAVENKTEEQCTMIVKSFIRLLGFANQEHYNKHGVIIKNSGVKVDHLKACLEQASEQIAPAGQEQKREVAFN